MRIPIVDFRPMRVACIRHIGPYNLISEAFGRLMSTVTPSVIAPDNYPQMVAIYYNDPHQTPADQLKSDAAVVIPESLKVPEGMHAEDISGGSYARYTHQGPYSDLGKAWDTFMGQLGESGVELQPAPMFELYMNDPNETPADDLVTDLFVKVAGPQL